MFYKQLADTIREHNRGGGPDRLFFQLLFLFTAHGHLVLADGERGGATLVWLLEFGSPKSLLCPNFRSQTKL